VSVRAAGLLLILPALVLDTPAAEASLAQAWPPFLLIAGLLTVGLIADYDGLFDAAAARLHALPGSPVRLLASCLALVALVTAILNLDTAAVFLTPVLVRTAQRRGVPVDAFLYGAVFMANASSLFLPGSNLTNLLVLSGGHVSGGRFLLSMLPSALGAACVTAAGLILLHGRALRARPGSPGRSAPRRRGNFAQDSRRSAPRRRGNFAPGSRQIPELRGRVGLAATLAAAILILALRNAALAVLAVGVLALAWRSLRGQLPLRHSLASLGLAALASLFGLAVALGTLARASTLPASLLHGAGTTATALIAALASILINNLPAAVVLSAPAHVHLDALLLGLDIGPNLAVTGSLAVLLWWRAARASGCEPSVRAYTLQGLALAPPALLAAIALAHL
jgi:arsenical pump membrane protein